MAIDRRAKNDLVGHGHHAAAASGIVEPRSFTRDASNTTTLSSAEAEVFGGPKRTVGSVLRLPGTAGAIGAHRSICCGNGFAAQPRSSGKEVFGTRSAWASSQARAGRFTAGQHRGIASREQTRESDEDGRGVSLGIRGAYHFSNDNKASETREFGVF